MDNSSPITATSELLLTRTEFTNNDTIGDITTEADYTWFTLELPNKDGKPGSCIPQGRYPIILLPSPKFLKSTDPWVLKYAHAMPHVIVPNRTDIMIHWGNTVDDTSGCILLGVTHPRGDFIAKSRDAFSGFYDLYHDEMLNKRLYLTVAGGYNEQA